MNILIQGVHIVTVEPKVCCCGQACHGLAGHKGLYKFPWKVNLVFYLNIKSPSLFLFIVQYKLFFQMVSTLDTVLINDLKVCCGDELGIELGSGHNYTAHSN